MARPGDAFKWEPAHAGGSSTASIIVLIPRGSWRGTLSLWYAWALDELLYEITDTRARVHAPGRGAPLARATHLQNGGQRHRAQ